MREFAKNVLTAQLNDIFKTNPVTSVQSPFVGKWEWCVQLSRAGEVPDVFLEFGPTAVVENSRAPLALDAPDYSKLFVTRAGPNPNTIDRIVQTTVGFDEVLAGLKPDDKRLRDAVLEIVESSG